MTAPNVRLQRAYDDSGSDGRRERADFLDALAGVARQGPVTLAFGARGVEHDRAWVIAVELEARLEAVGGSATPT